MNLTSRTSSHCRRDGARLDGGGARLYGVMNNSCSICSIKEMGGLNSQLPGLTTVNIFII